MIINHYNLYPGKYTIDLNEEELRLDETKSKLIDEKVGDQSLENSNTKQKNIMSKLSVSYF